jgi:hypothetical protein
MTIMVLEDYNPLATGLQILLGQDDFISFRMIVERRIVLAIFILHDTSLKIVIHPLSSPATSIRLSSCFYWHTGVGTVHDVD